MDVNATVAKRFNDLRIDIHANDFDSVGGKRGCGRQANIAKAKNTKLVEFQWKLLYFPIPSYKIGEMSRSDGGVKIAMIILRTTSVSDLRKIY